MVIALTEINSRHLRGESRRAGCEIELERALQDTRQGDTSDAVATRVIELRAKLEAADGELRQIEAEREKLEDELANFDNIVPKNKRGEWQ